MYNQSFRLLPFLAFLFLFGLPDLTAQVAIDVKSSWGVKEKVRYAKQGINSAIDATDRFRSTEFGEDYSLWLRSLDRRVESGGVIVVRLDVELRTPAFIGRGDLLSSDRIEIRYNPSTLDSIVSSPRAGIDRDDWLASSLLIDQVIKLASDVIPFPNALVRTALLSAADALNRAPTDGEIVEGALLGLKVVESLEARLIQLGEHH